MTVSPSGVDQLNCNAIDCADNTAPVPPECPPDSLPAPLRHQVTGSGGVGGLCCEPVAIRLTCQCLPCDQTVCGPSEVKVLVEEGLATPGQCCDVHQCVNQCEFSSLHIYKAVL